MIVFNNFLTSETLTMYFTTFEWTKRLKHDAYQEVVLIINVRG
jgi:hypothetical protein